MEGTYHEQNRLHNIFLLKIKLHFSHRSPGGRQPIEIAGATGNPDHLRSSGIFLARDDRRWSNRRKRRQMGRRCPSGEKGPAPGDDAAAGRRNVVTLRLKWRGRLQPSRDAPVLEENGGRHAAVRPWPQHFDRRSARRLQILFWIVFGYFAVVQSKRVEQIHDPLGDDREARR